MAYNDIPKDRTAINDQEDDYLEIDKSGAMSSIDAVHYKIHEGNLYSSTHLFTSVADGASVEMVGITGDKEAHLLALAKSTGEATVEFEKGTTFTDNGTAVPATNRNETSTNTSTVSIYHSPTSNNDGTVFSKDLIVGGGRGASAIGGEAGIRQEFVVEPNSNHVLRVTNNSGAEQRIFIEFIWYEV